VRGTLAQGVRLFGLTASVLLLCMVAIAATKVKTMNVSVGKEFTLTLEANRTTGYAWEAHYDANLLSLKEPRYVPLAPNGPPGSPGKAVFTFMPIKPGQTTIKMLYQRPWEKCPVREENFSVVIQAAGN
jgi:inhibitor of cysteine peptidase